MTFYASKVKSMTAIAAAIALALSACGKGGDTAKGEAGGAGQQAAAQQAPAPVVGVVTVHPETIALTTELPGRLEALRTADVRAQDGGIIQNACSKRAAMSAPGSRFTKSTAPPMKQIWKARAPSWQARRQLLLKPMPTWRVTNRWLPPMPSANRTTMRR